MLHNIYSAHLPRHASAGRLWRLWLWLRSRCSRFQGVLRPLLQTCPDTLCSPFHLQCGYVVTFYGIGFQEALKRRLVNEYFTRINLDLLNIRKGLPKPQTQKFVREENSKMIADTSKTHLGQLALILIYGSTRHHQITIIFTDFKN